MFGRLFTLFEVIPFPSYFTLLVTGFVFATAMGAVWARRIGQDPDVVVDLGLAMLMAGVIGGRLLHVVADGYFWDYVHLCTDPAAVNWQVTEAQCRSTSYDGVWDAALGVCHPRARGASGTRWTAAPRGSSLARRVRVLRGLRPRLRHGLVRPAARSLPVLEGGRHGRISVALGLGFGRMGCHLAGCCFGATSTVPWSVVFPGHSPASESQWKLGLLGSPAEPSLAVHPTQLYESAGSLAISAFLLLYLHARKRYDGQVFLAFVVAYAVLRFLLELVRADYRGGLFGLSTSQLIGVGLVAAALVAHRRLGARADAAVANTAG
jgi:phosphatidylglycerol:prolipoprotein diacylglycerol transferase